MQSRAANICESSHICQLLFEGNFTNNTGVDVETPKCRSSMTAEYPWYGDSDNRYEIVVKSQCHIYLKAVKLQKTLSFLTESIHTWHNDYITNMTLKSKVKVIYTYDECL